MASRNFSIIATPPEVLVFVDLASGELDDAGKGSLSEASRLAKTLGGSWSALAFAPAQGADLSAFAPYGTPELTLIEATPEVADCLESQGRLLAEAAKKRSAPLLLLPHNDLGAALAPLLAAELQGALFTEALGYQRDGDALSLTRTELGAQVVETKIWTGATPLVLTVLPRILSAVVLPTMQQRTPELCRWQSSEPLTAGPTRILERIPPDPQTVDVSEAEAIISAGLGCNTESFAQVEELARLLNASLGVTRPVYDLGRAGFERMVGQTGKTVAPRFYLALGISGSMHHLGGIKDSKKVVAVNLDPKVPIFPNSDEGFVADLRQVLPLLIERVKSATGGGA
ncbi:MAG: electron transfer flavoprotein subunit alpha/FixB family protein [Trichloromonadaceae bacterium]